LIAGQNLPMFGPVLGIIEFKLGELFPRSIGKKLTHSLNKSWDHQIATNFGTKLIPYKSNLAGLLQHFNQ
jgi:hypothetical protein